MKIQGRVKIKRNDGTIELGRLFWVLGTVDEPEMGSIFVTESEAPEFDSSEFEMLEFWFGDVCVFYRVDS